MEGFAVSPPGFEDLVARELRSLGLSGVVAVAGGATFRGGWPDVYRTNLLCRVASRILVRVVCFEAETFSEMEQGLGRVDWQRWISANRPVDVRVTKRGTRLYHTARVSELVLASLGRLCGARLPERNESSLRVQVRIRGREVTVSLDTSGEHLHRRSYRRELSWAPIRENLAAGLLMRARWRGSTPLLDPMCGSGTFAIEGALMALRCPPGRLRNFAFETLPSFDPGQWARVRETAEAAMARSLPEPVFASDRELAPIQLTARSARRAGLGDQLQVAQINVADLDPPAPSGLLVANPPHGRRLGGEGAAYAALGKALAGPFRRWRWGIVIGGAGASAAIEALRPSVVHRFRSGGRELGFALGGPS